MSEKSEKTFIESIDHGMDNPPKLKDLQSDLSAALVEHANVMNDINRWRKVRKADKKKAEKSRSNYQSKLVRTQNEWVYPDLTEPLLSPPNLFDISAKSPGDIDKAIQNHLVLNNQFNNQLDKVRIIDKLVHILVNDSTVVLRTGWETKSIIETKEEPTYTFTPIPPEHPAVLTYQRLAGLEQQGELPVDQLAPEVVAGYKYSIASGQPMIAEQSGTKKVKYSKTISNTPTLEVMPYDKVIVDPNAKGDRNQANFVIFEFEISKSDMKSQPERYFNVDKIKDTVNEDIGEISQESATVTVFDYSDKSLYLHTAYEYWGYADIDNTGIAMPFVATWIDNVMVRLEKHPIPKIGLPIAIIHYMPRFDRNVGEADAELIEDDQKVISSLSRGIIDTMAKSANAQKGVREGVLDYVNEKRFYNNQDFKFKSNVPDPRQLFHVFQYPELPSSVNWMMNLHLKNAETLSGIQPFGSEGIKNTDSAVGVRNIINTSNKRKSSVLRRITSGLREVAEQIINMNWIFLDEEEVVRVTDREFVTVNREDLKGEFDISIEVATPESNEVKAKDLAFMIQTDTKADPEFRRMVQAEIAKLRGMDKFAAKIRDFEPKPDPMAQRMQELSMQLLEAQIQNELGKAHENRANGDFDQARIHTEAAKAMKLRAEAEALDLDFIEQSQGVHQERQKELAVLNHLSSNAQKSKN